MDLSRSFRGCPVAFLGESIIINTAITSPHLLYDCSIYWCCSCAECVLHREFSFSSRLTMHSSSVLGADISSLYVRVRIFIRPRTSFFFVHTATAAATDVHFLCATHNSAYVYFTLSFSIWAGLTITSLQVQSRYEPYVQMQKYASITPVRCWTHRCQLILTANTCLSTCGVFSTCDWSNGIDGPMDCTCDSGYSGAFCTGLVSCIENAPTYLIFCPC